MQNFSVDLDRLGVDEDESDHTGPGAVIDPRPFTKAPDARFISLDNACGCDKCPRPSRWCSATKCQESLHSIEPARTFMPRFDFLTFLVFLIAVTGNCVQATQITLDPIGSSVTVLSTSRPSTDNSEFLFTNDETDDTPNLILVQNTFSSIDALLISVTFPIEVVPADQVERSRILRL
jgi:hypothetical protein